MRYIEVGDKFNSLTVIDTGYYHTTISGRRLEAALCECECGHLKIVANSYLRNSCVKTCGFCIRYNPDGTLKRKVVHSKPKKTKSDILSKYGNIHYVRATKMLERCNNPKSDSYHLYGERGIKCLLGSNVKEVISSIEKIPGYFEGATLDRIDPNGHYTFDNVRWADSKTQSLNKRSSITLDNIHNVSRLLKDFRRMCVAHGWDPQDFFRIKDVNYRNRWFYYYKFNDYAIMFNECDKKEIPKNKFNFVPSKHVYKEIIYSLDLKTYVYADDNSLVFSNIPEDYLPSISDMEYIMNGISRGDIINISD